MPAKAQLRSQANMPKGSTDPDPDPVTVKVENDFDGFAICQKIETPTGALPPHYGTTGPWYKCEVISNGKHSVSYTPSSAQWFIVDFSAGFKCTNENLYEFAYQYYTTVEEGIVPADGHCPIVTAS